MRESREGCAVIAHKDFIYIFGGVGTKTVESYDTKKNTWKAMPNMEHHRHGHSAIAIKDEVFILGGQNGKNTFVSSMAVFDLESDKWKEVDDESNLPIALSDLAAVRFHKWIVVIGGMKSDKSNDVNEEIFVYDTEHSNWQQVNKFQ